MFNKRTAVFPIALIASIASTAWLAGCTPSKVAATLVLKMDDSATAEQVAGAAQILTERFKEVTPGSFADVTPTISDHTISFAFRGGAPTETTVRVLSKERGEFGIYAAENASDVWITDADVLEARLATKAGGEFVNVRLKPEAGKRLEAKTAANVGKTLIASWDGQQVMSSQIHGPFGETFEFTSPSEELGRVMQVTLGHGRLLVAMRSFDYRVAP
jgi:preprotein translocase subunit SecD